MSLTRRGFFQQRKGMAFARHLDVQNGDSKAIVFRFRPSGFFSEAETKCRLPAGWYRDENGDFLVRTRNTETPGLPLEEDSKGKRIVRDGFILRVPLRDFPAGIPEEDWVNCRVLYCRADQTTPTEYFVQNRPASDRGGRLTLTVMDRQAVLDDSPGAGKGNDYRGFRTSQRLS